MYICIYICVCVCVCTYVCMYVCMYVYRQDRTAVLEQTERTRHINITFLSPRFGDVLTEPAHIVILVEGFDFESEGGYAVIAAGGDQVMALVTNPSCCLTNLIHYDTVTAAGGAPGDGVSKRLHRDNADGFARSRAPDHSSCARRR